VPWVGEIARRRAGGAKTSVHIPLKCALTLFRFAVLLPDVSFRPFIPNFWRAALVGLACLAFAGAARAGEGARNIEVVPFHNTAMDTNFDQPSRDDSQNLNLWKQFAPNSLTPSAPPTRLTPLPQTQQSLSKEQQQMLERRRNWVFMTPEDYATTDSKTGKNPLGRNDDNDDNMSSIERYYHRLEKSTQSSATNEFSRLNPDRLTGRTNYFDNPVHNTDSGMFGQTPFNSSPNADVFQPATIGNSANVFGENDTVAAQTPEDIRLQAAQKAHTDSFKQLWDIDQASSAATPVTPQLSVPIDSAPLFGASTPGMSTPFRPNIPTMGGNPVKPLTPAGQPVTTPRYTAPPHSDFTPVPRSF
jgi:hypothetical protein